MYEIKLINLKEDYWKQQFINLMYLRGVYSCSASWLEWKHLNNPYHDSAMSLVGAIEDKTNALIGMRPLMFHRLVVNGETYKIAQPCDTVVHPGYRKKNIFHNMNKKIIEKASNNNYTLFFNFPNSNSLHGYIKQGWKITGTIEAAFCFRQIQAMVKEKSDGFQGKIASIVLPVLIKDALKLESRLSALEAKNIQVAIENDFTEEFEMLWQQKADNKARVKRDKAYLYWRFTQRPDKDYIIYTARDKGVLQGYLIASISYNRQYSTCQIVDFQHLDKSIFYALLRRLTNDLLENHNVFILELWSFTEQKLLQQLYKLGFVSRSNFPYKYFTKNNSFMLVNVLNQEFYETVNDINNWSIRLCDHDVQ